MANKTKANKRRSNPLSRTGGTGRPKIKFDGHTVTSVLFQDHSTGVGNTCVDWQAVDSSNNEAINRTGSDVIKHYQNYRYTMASVEWLPKIGPADPNSGARVSIAYIDNPELIVAYKAATPTAKVAMCRTVANCRSFNLWERFTYRVPLTFRRKWFNTDVQIGTPSAEETDRAIQGLVLCVIEGTNAAAPAAGTLGQYKLTSTTVLQGFTSTVLT